MKLLYIFEKNIILRKILITFSLIIIFLLGRYVPIPGVLISAYKGQDNNFATLYSTVTGGNLSQVGVFSLGIGPMMTTMILLRLFTIGKYSSGVSQKVQQFLQNVVMLVIAIIQGLAITISFQYHNGFSLTKLLLATMILVTGAYIISWIGNLNAEYGFGGMTILVVVGMLVGQFNNIPLIFELFQDGYQLAIILFLLWTLVAMYLMITFERSEYRIPVMRTSIHNRLVDDAYMPIKVNASGGMAFMYVYTLLMFPQYIIILLRSIFPTNPDITSYNDYFSLSSIQGVVIYMILMLVLSVAFTFVNIDPTKISEAMRESGDFIPNYRPGKETQSYLSKICYLFGTFSGFFMAFLGGVPLLFALGNDDLRTVSSMTGIFMMITGMSFMILDEFQVIRIRKQYTSVFENEEN